MDKHNAEINKQVAEGAHQAAENLLSDAEQLATEKTIILDPDFAKQVKASLESDARKLEKIAQKINPSPDKN